MEETSTTITASKLRQVIGEFIQIRLQAKLDKLKEGQHEEREKLLAAHEPEAWLAEKAVRAGEIQQVTHVVKFTHPLIKLSKDYRVGSNLLSKGNSAAGENVVGSHLLGDTAALDIAGNAAALDVYKFLRLEVAGRSLLALALERHPALREALSADANKADEWMGAFAGLVEAKGKPASHTLAKQLYWPLGGGQYHLLAPLFPSSLVSTVWSTLREHRFSDDARAAREAARNKTAHAHGYHEYPNVVVQKFGGTKPQNISQLNSERYGENHLLPSVPPSWQSPEVRPPLNSDSIFVRGFANQRVVREGIEDLRRYLQRVKDVNNKPVREGRARRVQALFDALLQYAAQLWDLPAGWSANPECKLNAAEQCWLDPQRCALDQGFAERYQQSDWQEQICSRFANWLNARLFEAGKGLSVGEHEAQEWRHLLDRELTMLHRELRHD